eukprot:TRINITY_DN12942_c0_g1_i1.p1 TRINITY_DN12942_c0_g1~~TRINITY_DN12942_c0_g1_i1.p1  ORF type:complete len:293 (-),score=40.62 TRINITY_DN12942_c0_g1_i1:199-1077(-)
MATVLSPFCVIVMGVSGSGKTTIGEALATHLSSFSSVKVPHTAPVAVTTAVPEAASAELETAVGESTFALTSASAVADSTLQAVPFYDGDEFHGENNVAKMQAGLSLTDDDRWPWLRSIRENIEENLTSGRSAIYACSSLRQAYRDVLSGRCACMPSTSTASACSAPSSTSTMACGTHSPGVVFVYLKGSFEVIFQRLSLRPDHFFPPKLLKSQFDALEEPNATMRYVRERNGEKTLCPCVDRKCCGETGQMMCSSGNCNRGSVTLECDVEFTPAEIVDGVVLFLSEMGFIE